MRLLKQPDKQKLAMCRGPPHPRDDGKSAQPIDSKTVARRPWHQRVRNRVKTKGIAGKHIGTVAARKE